MLQAGDEFLEAGFVGTGCRFVGFGDDIIGIEHILQGIVEGVHVFRVVSAISR